MYEFLLAWFEVQSEGLGAKPEENRRKCVLSTTDVAGEGFGFGGFLL